MRTVSLLLVCGAAHATEMVHQGRLTDASGNPVNGSYDITVSLYSGTSGAHWTDTFDDVAVQAGYYAVVLGSGVALDDGDLSLPALSIGITLNTDPELVRLDLFADAVLGGGGTPIELVTTATPNHRRYADGTYATACHTYRHPTDGHQYEGATGDGVYRVDPDGPGANGAPFDVYCDMTRYGGGWTLVDQDADVGLKISSPRTLGAHTDRTTTGGRYLPSYAWSDDPMVLCQASAKSSTDALDWVVLRADGPHAYAYPTATTATGTHSYQWGVQKLNGNTDQGTTSWAYQGGTNFGTLWIGNGSNSTCSCGYGSVGQLGVGTYVSGTAGTCSTWVR